jgi:glutamate--cysteine ligase catalytic subunit
MKSIFIPDKAITSHPRFGYIINLHIINLYSYSTLAKNIRLRRGSNVDIRIPIYKDINTNITVETKSEPYPGMIYMDCMAFGMGNTCFQLTLGFCSLNMSLFSHDLLTPLTPIIVRLLILLCLARTKC